MEYYASIENEDKELKAVGLELMFLTPEKCSADLMMWILINSFRIKTTRTVYFFRTI